MTNAPTSPPADPLAHLTQEGRPHLLIDHLTAVGEGAARFAGVFGAADHARVAGLWHDLGKYRPAFQSMIRAANGFEAHLEDAPGRVDHSTAGAIHAAKTLGAAGAAIAFAIAGHHAGLSNQLDLTERLRAKGALLEDAKRGGAPADLLDPPALATPGALRGKSPEHRRLQEMWTRMLFSALCDADRLDTEAFYDAGKAALRGGAPAVATLGARLAKHLDDIEARAEKTEVNRVRAEVRAACVAAAAEPPGVFSLTVPTGGGKTLASLAFALAHAERHGLGRVVVAIPFTSIIEQNARVFRDALGESAVLEHHSAFDPPRETAQNYLAAAENWDASVIVTTTVQLFESLFANRPRACRKLHRLARSVIVLDEAQTLPPGMLAPILDALRMLVEHFGASVVICTATQPAFRKEPWLSVGFDEVHEIVPAGTRAFERLERVRVHWPASEEPTDYATLATDIAAKRDVLAIVHLRKDARALCQEVDGRLGHEETLHLSALMCPDHRSRMLADIKRRKKAGEAIRLVATQVVEAGVDVDFAVVYRALGGMDSLAQAAGRCNREGKLELPGLGELHVFHAPTKPPPGVPQAALEVSKVLLAQRPDLNLFAPETYASYFRQLYSSRDLDKKKVQDARAAFNFENVASRFAIIEDDWSAPVVVPYGRAAVLVRLLERGGPSRRLLRALQRFAVNVSRKDRDAWVAAKLVRVVAETAYVIDPVLSAAYDLRFGLVPDRMGVGDAGSCVL
jgi:CRISPR-associated endonuclease/helicase Cas3